MNKNIIKEIIIALLMCFAIILLLGLLLYEYVPANKTLPETVSYTTPSSVSKELISTGGIDENSVIRTYQLDSADISNYQKINNYNPGKTNPFATASNGETGNNNENSTGGSTTNNNGSTTNNGGTTNKESSNAQGEKDSNTHTGYVQDKGTK